MSLIKRIMAPLTVFLVLTTSSFAGVKENNALNKANLPYLYMNGGFENRVIRAITSDLIQELPPFPFHNGKSGSYQITYIDSSKEHPDTLYLRFDDIDGSRSQTNGDKFYILNSRDFRKVRGLPLEFSPELVSDEPSYLFLKNGDIFIVPPIKAQEEIEELINNQTKFNSRISAESWYLIRSYIREESYSSIKKAVIFHYGER